MKINFKEDNYIWSAATLGYSSLSPNILQPGMTDYIGSMQDLMLMFKDTGTEAREFL